MKKLKNMTVRKLLMLTFISLAIVNFCFLIGELIWSHHQFKIREDKDIEAVTGMIAQTMLDAQTINSNTERLFDYWLFYVSKGIAEDIRESDHWEDTEALKQVAQKWGVHDISVFQFKNDLLTVTASSDPKEIGLIANDWGYWFTAMQELMLEQTVSVDKGLHHENYWIGPISRSEVYNAHFKYAYYYDAESGLLINPIVSAEQLKAYLNPFGSEQLLHKITESYPNIIEITVINTKAFVTPGIPNVEPSTDLPILWGTNEWATDRDIEFAEKAQSTGAKQSFKFRHEEKRHLEKVFIPLPEDRTLFIMFDHSELAATRQQAWRQSTMMFIASSFVILAIILSVNRRSIKLLKADLDRLAVAEEFKRTIEVLPSSIFKIIQQDGQYVFSYFEGGGVPADTERSNSSYIGLTLEQALQAHPSTKELFIHHVSLAFQGKSEEFDSQWGDRHYHNVLKPIADPHDPSRTIEIAGYSLDITERVEAENHIRWLANNDMLTGLSNRRMFQETFAKYIVRYKHIAVLFIDLDEFKSINDTHGHEAGDVVLREIAERIQNKVKDKGIVSRLGGDEFTVLVHSYSTLDELARLTEHLLRTIQRPIEYNDQTLRITASIGISEFPIDAHSPEDLLRFADMAMYAAKKRGKKQYEFYSNL